MFTLTQTSLYRSGGTIHNLNLTTHSVQLLVLFDVTNMLAEKLQRGSKNESKKNKTRDC